MPALLLLLAALNTGIAQSPAQVPIAGRYQARAITMTIEADGRVNFTGPRGPMITSRVSLSRDTVTFRDEGGPAACIGDPGRYTFALAGDTLRFRLVADPCQGRRGAMAQAWNRVAAALVMTGVTLIDGTGAPVRNGMTVVVRDSLITGVYPDGSEPAPPGAEVRDLRNHWLLPGLIDAHVHVATDPSTSDRRDAVERRLRNALLGGVIAVRDMGGDGRALADLARDAAVGDIVAPLIRYSAIMAGPDFFADPRVLASSAGVVAGTAPWARAITAATDVRQVIAEARGIGVTAVKFYADLDSSTVARVGAEARRQGLQVWAHAALFPASPRQVAAAGVDVVSHALLLAWGNNAEQTSYTDRARIDLSVGPGHEAVTESIRRMKAADVIFEPTLWVYRAPPDAADTASVRRREQRAIAFTRAVHQAGVRIAAGTDGIGPDRDGALPNLHDELGLLVRAGLSPMEALVAATRTNARALGLGESRGQVAVGRLADLLVLRADPLRDIANTREIAFVVQGGRIRSR